MRQLQVKPEVSRYFYNSKTYYLEGIVLEPIIEENFFLPKGSSVQLVFEASALGSINLPAAKELLFSVEDLARESFSRGKPILRFIVIKVNENY